ncbi:MAG: hypothetical protein FWH37_05485 [Candidatus Bathyarchaeota archaeon]|nr:hypothetical protein [Candidatus Termiticorpusculum sp.]
MSKCYILLRVLYVIVVIKNNVLMGKNKILIKIVSIMLICLMTLSSASLTFGNFASAATGAVNFLPNLAFYPDDPDPNRRGFDTQNELDLSTTTAQYITNKLSTKYPTSYYSAYDTNCNLANYQSVTSVTSSK